MNGNHRPEGVLYTSWTLESVRPFHLTEVAQIIMEQMGLSLADTSPPSGLTDFCYTPEQEQIIEARLRAMGYLE